MKKIVSMFLVITLLLGVCGNSVSVFAQESTNVSHDSKVENLTKDLEKELIFLFEEATSYQNGEQYVNKDLLIEKYGKEKAPLIAMGIERIYKKENLAANLRSELENRHFISCMGEELVGMITGMELVDLMSGNLKSYIEGKLWGKVAGYIAKKLVKFGLKSNVAGIAAQLAISAGKCAIWG